MNGPLAGKRVVNTRAAHQAAALDALLHAEGAIPVAFPCIAIEPVADPRALDAALKEALSGGYDWVLFTSVNTVRAVEARRCAVGAGSWGTAPCQLAAVGRATGAAIERALGRTVDLAPERQDAAGLATMLPVRSGERVLIPASSQARPNLADALRARGAAVTVVTAYETVPAISAPNIRSLLGSIDAVVFASPSAVMGFAERMMASGLEPDALAGRIVACIGPTTLAAAEAEQFPHPLMAAEPSLDSLIDLLRTACTLRNDQEAIHPQ